MKATYVEIDGVGQAIFKDPKTDSGTKKSAKGLLQVDRDVNGNYRLINDVSVLDEKEGELRTVFKDGKILVMESFADIRSRLGVI
jgi:nicotinamide phosphoribosyltransferase